MHKWCLVFGDNPRFWMLPLSCETTDPVNGLDYKANIPVYRPHAELEPVTESYDLKDASNDQADEHTGLLSQ